MKNNRSAGFQTRRELIQRGALAASAVAVFGALPGRAMSGSVPSPVLGVVTAPGGLEKPLSAVEWDLPMLPAEGRIVIDEDDRRQKVLGFGAAFTDASCYLIGRMSQADRRQILEEFFGASGMRLSVGRTCIGSSDYSRSAYSFDDSAQPDPELKNFTIAHDRAYILPTLREALTVNPGLFLFSAPWSPPAWMKAGGSLLGGSMEKRYFAAYAQYFVRFLKEYRDAGVPIRAVTSQNEVDTSQDSRMPAALWGQEDETHFIKQFLGPALRDHNIDAEIWILDHNYDLWGRVMDQLGDPELARYVAGVAWHGYMGTPDAMTRVHNAFPGKSAYWTEGGPDYTAPDYETDWAAWGARFAGILKNWSRTIVAWNLVLDEHGQPNIGPFECGGVITLPSNGGALRRSGQYWALRRYARAIASGAQIVGTSGVVPGVEHVAAINPDGSHALLLTNQGAERRVEVHFREHRASVALSANSITALQWN
jgi:glucosylceramidase